jgi:hypothetical protein
LLEKVLVGEKDGKLDNCRQLRGRQCRGSYKSMRADRVDSEIQALDPAKMFKLDDKPELTVREVEV